MSNDESPITESPTITRRGVLKSGRVDQIGCFFSRRIWKAMASTRNISAGDLDQRQTESQGGFEGESHCWTDPIRLKQDKQLGVVVLCPRLL